MLTLISYNVMFTDIILQERHTALIKILRYNNPDVICLQEVLASVVPWFIQLLADLYTPIIFELLPIGRHYGELIFVKKEIQQISFECVPLPSKMGRALQHAEFKKGSEIFHVVTFHLESMNCSKVRRTQLELMWTRFSSLPNVIYCGDTNMTAKEKYVLPDNVYDSWEEIDQEIGTFTYHSHRYWDGNRQQRYDKVWISNDLKLVGFGVIGSKPLKELGGKWISDHDGLYVCVN